MTRNTVKLKNIVDTWNVIERYQVKDWKQKDYNSSISVPVEEFERALSKVKNRGYILNLVQK